MEECPISDEEVLVDYGEFTEEEIKEMNSYVTRYQSIASSVNPAIATFHDPSLSSDHGRNAATASEGLEGPPMILTPPASPDQPGMQGLLKDVTVDVPSHEIGFQSLASKKRLSQKQRKRARLRAQVSNNLSMDQRLPESSQKAAPNTHGRQGAAGAPGLAMVIVSEPSDLRPLPKGRRPEPKRVRSNNHGEVSASKLRRHVPNSKTGKPALAFGIVPPRSGHSSYADTESEELLTEDRVRSRVTSITLDPGNEGDDELQGSDPVDPRSRMVEVVRQVDQEPPSVRKTVMPDQLVRYNGEWAVQRLPEIQYPPEFREGAKTGQIPLPRDRGNMMRRVLSAISESRHPDVHHWRSKAGDHKYRVNKSQCILVGSLERIVKELAERNHHLDKFTADQAELNPQEKLYLEWVRERSPLILTLRNFHSRVRRLYGIVSAMLEANRQELQAGSGKEAPEIVRTTAHYCCQIMGAIKSVVSAIAGEAFDRVNWHAGSQHPVMRSDHFKRCLWNELGDYLEAKKIKITEDYPWLFRYTENMKRDCVG